MLLRSIVAHLFGEKINYDKNELVLFIINYCKNISKSRFYCLRHKIQRESLTNDTKILNKNIYSYKYNK
jgi:hypothetical protein